MLAIAILAILLTFSFSSMNLESGFAMLSNSAMIFLLPIFTFSALIGLFIRNRSKTARMLTSIAVASAVTAAFSSVLIGSIESSSIGTVEEREQAQGVIATMGVVTFLSCALGALVTYIWLLRNTKTK